MKHFIVVALIALFAFTALNADAARRPRPHTPPPVATSTDPVATSTDPVIEEEIPHVEYNPGYSVSVGEGYVQDQGVLEVYEIPCTYIDLDNGFIMAFLDGLSIGLYNVLFFDLDTACRQYQTMP